MQDIFNGNINKDVAFAETPKPNSKWIKMNIFERKLAITSILKLDGQYKDIEVVNAMNNGQVILEINCSIPASKRGLLLLELEKKLKKQIDISLTVWLNPIGDKSKLRNLRGIKIKEIE
jgi:hypothetical protein